MVNHLLSINKYQFLRQLRESTELSQAQVAAAVNADGRPLSQTLLSQIECGYCAPTPRLVEAIKSAISRLASQRQQRTDQAFREAPGKAEVSR